MRILIVEDEHKIARSIKKGLEQENYAVDLAFDGETGVDLAVSESFDLIIVDRMLPGMDGLEICRKIRANKIHTPVLVLTAKGQIEDRVEGLDAGADDYLVKPFAFEELLARLRALKRRPSESLNVVLTVGTLVLDTASFEVKRKGRSVLLSSREFSLLEYLMRHPDRVLTKDEIIAHVWSYDSDILPNTVEVYIGYLRAKIDKFFGGKKMIQTVRGRGYKIVGETDV